MKKILGFLLLIPAILLIIVGLITFVNILYFIDILTFLYEMCSTAVLFTAAFILLYLIFFMFKKGIYIILNGGKEND